MSDSQFTATAEAFAQKLRQKYPQHAAALGDHLIAAFVKDHPQYRVTYDGNKAVNVSWTRIKVSTAAASVIPATISPPTPGAGVGTVVARPDDESGSQARTVDKRKHLRVPCKGTRAYIISDNVPGVVVDVVETSRGGLRFVSFERFDQGTAVSVAIHYIAGDQNIFKDGLIVRAWHQRSGMLPNEYAVKFSL